MNCGIHNKPMKQSSKGWYCATPIQKDADGKVLTWCTWKPSDLPSEPSREPIKERNYDEEARGKIRSLFIQAKISRDGLVPLDTSDLITLDTLVEVAMGTK